MAGDVLGCLGKYARWFPEVVPGEGSQVAHVKSSAAEPVTLERASFGLPAQVGPEPRLLRKVNIMLI